MHAGEKTESSASGSDSSEEESESDDESAESEMVLPPSFLLQEPSHA